MTLSSTRITHVLQLEQPAAQCLIDPAIKKLPATFCLPGSSTSSFRETYLRGKSSLSRSALEESGGDLGKLLWGVLAPASREDGSHSEARSLLGKAHLVTHAQFSAFLVIKSLVLDSSYVALVSSRKIVLQGTLKEGAICSATENNLFALVPN